MQRSDLDACVDACHACALASEHCASECLADPGAAALARCIRLSTDCAQICALAVAFMARGSESAKLLCEDCAAICERCAEECDRHDMPHCRDCATACRACMQACLRMAQAPIDEAAMAAVGLPRSGARN
jgi:hypothetical protein